MKKFFLVFFLTITTIINPCHANEIDKCIKNSNFNLHSTVSILVQNSNSEKVLYKKNEQKLLNPASVLKLITFGASYLELGPDYDFTTALYLDDKNNLYLKLSGDTLLTSSDLNKLFSELKTKINVNNINYIYIDDSIIDKTPYSKGWMEDDIWPNSRPLSPYIIDNNYVQIAIRRSSLATNVDIIQNDPYKLAIINELKLGDNQKIEITNNSNIVNFKGTISKDQIIKLPVLSPEVNFNVKLKKVLEKNKITYLKTITPKKVPQNAKKIAQISRSIKEISKPILYNSDNFSAEIIFRVAAAKYINYEKSADINDCIKMLVNKFPTPEMITIADGSGVSRYNLLNSEYINSILLELNADEEFKSLLMSPGQGTLTNRLMFIDKNLKAKTGTLKGVSSLAGYLTTKKGNNVVFCILIQNSPKRQAVLKNFEDRVVTAIYRKY